MANQLVQAGAQPNKQPTYVPLFVDRAFTGLHTNRPALHDPSDWVTSKFYGGRPDALLDGSNVELTDRLTLQRRPGLTSLSATTYPTPPNRTFSFETNLNGQHRLIVDTGSTGNLQVTAAAATSGTYTDYTGSFPNGAADAYVGMVFTITGFSNEQNNGTYTCTASSASTLRLDNTKGIAEIILAGIAVSTGGVYYDKQDGSLAYTNILFGKGAGAGQAYFVAVAGVLYIGDGVEVKKYTPDNTNGEIWNWGIAAPDVPPTLTIINAGTEVVDWQADTYFSTMGLIVDASNNIQALTTVNFLGDNPNSSFGTSGVGGPPWKHTIGGDTVDGTATWRNLGTLLPWTPTTNYADFGHIFGGLPGVPANTGCSLFDTATNQIVIHFNTVAAYLTTGTVQPSFTPIQAGVTNEPVPVGAPVFTMHWYSFGSGNFPQWPDNLPVVVGQYAVEHILPPFEGETTYLHVCVTGGTTSAAYSTPSGGWGTSAGDFTPDNQLLWICLGSKNWVANTHYTAWSSPNTYNFSAIVDSNGNFQVCIETGTSAGVAPTWETDFGSITTDGTVKWANCGSAATASWHASKAFCLPQTGFSPSQGKTYGGAGINDGTDIEYVVISGLSGGVIPVWATDQYSTTADNEVTWINNGPPAAHSFSWTRSISYRFSYMARTETYFYNTNAVPEGNTGNQQLDPTPLGPYLGSGTGAVSTSSPEAVLSTAHNDVMVLVEGPGSLDEQVDTVQVYRTTDGGSTWFYLTDLPNPAPVNGNAGHWSFYDYMPDLATAELPGLNILISAPIDGENDPPPDDFRPMEYNFSKIWGSFSERNVGFSGGTDVLVGNPNEAFNPANVFPFLNTVVRCVKTAAGLLVLEDNNIEIIAGGPTTASFYPVTLAPGIGLGNYNGLDVYCGEIFFVSSDGRFTVLSPELQLSNIGFPIANRVVLLDATQVYVAVYQVGLDTAIFLADGSTGWYRLNPRQVPGGFNGPEPIWSPFATITNGCKMVQSVETSSGIRTLLVGSATAGRKILKRNLAVFTDDGTQFDAWFSMGSIMMCNPGQLAILKFMEMDFSGVAYRPTISYLLNEISGVFTPFTLAPVYDPPELYGTMLAPTSYSPNRYYFSSTGSLARCRHMQIKVDLGTTPNGDEMYNITIFGRLITEP